MSINYQTISGMNKTHSLKVTEPSNFFYGWRSDRQYLVATDGEQVAGLLCFVPNSFTCDNAVGLAYLEVLPSYKNNGIATKLLKQLYRLAKKLGRRVYVTSYAPEGLQYLQPVVTKLAKTMDVTVVEKDMQLML